MANVNPLPCNTVLDLNMNIMDNCTSGTAREKDVKYLKCVDDNCPGNATLKMETYV